MASIMSLYWAGYVAPYTGAWIETIYEMIKQKEEACRTLYGCVD